MTIRNLNPQTMFEQLALEHVPSRQFKGKNPADFRRWKAGTWPEVLKCLAEFPARVPLNPELLAEWTRDGLKTERWIIDVQRHISATFLISYPAGLKKSEKRPAILCWHGHGPFGKDPVMGNDASPELRQQIEQCNYDYGRQMARKGFVTYAIDWMGCGERHPERKPNHRKTPTEDPDWCSLFYQHATMLGMTPLSINVTHGMAATDFAASFPFVDKARLGVMGMSGGGTMALWSALCDPRTKATEVICYSDLWAYFGVRDLNYCGMQIAPGLFKLLDLPDLQGLLAPRPLLVDIGAYDSCFLVDTAMACYKKVARIYKAAGASGNLELDLFPGEHGWGANKSEAFFQKHLGWKQG